MTDVVRMATTLLSDSIRQKHRICQNFLLIWLDANIDELKEDCQSALLRLRSVANKIDIFTESNEAVDFLTEVRGEKAFLIVQGTIGRDILPLIHDIPQLDSIYVVDDNPTQYEQWSKDWIKIKGVHIDMQHLCEVLQLAAKQCNQDSIAMSFITLGKDSSDIELNQLESSFMYTQIFKEILLDMEYDQQSVKNFTTYCREGNHATSSSIDRFENEYSDKTAIWWYTFSPFAYPMINAALRLMEGEIIIKMGFFIHDLHIQIQQLHQKQFGINNRDSFTIYRGQGLSLMNFEKLQKMKGGLLAFNNFLSTSKDREMSLIFAMGALSNPDMVGILFRITIDPSVSSTPFASIQEVSQFETEEEILFSMHTVFRVVEIPKLTGDGSIYEVDLQLTADDDQELRTLTNRIRDEVVAKTGWERLGLLLLRIGYFSKAEELYTVLIEQTSDLKEKSTYNINLGYINEQQGDNQAAIEYYKQAAEILETTLPSNDHDLGTCYNNIGMVFTNMGEYLQALSFYEKAVEIFEKILSPDHHPSLAASYNNIGMIYDRMGEYSKALPFCQKALEIFEKTLPPNHPDLATFCNNIGMMYNNIGEYSKALSFYQKSLDIRQKTLPSTHPVLASSYNTIGMLYSTMAKYSEALVFHQKALEIRQKVYPSNHPSLAASYNNIGTVYNSMGEYSKALSFYEKDLEISENTLSPNHPTLIPSYNNIGLVYMDMGEYSKALSSYQKAFEICRNTLPPNYPLLATCYNNIGLVYNNMKEYSNALSSHEKALEIFKKILPSDHPSLATCYNNIGLVYTKMEEYSRTLSFYQKALEIFEKTLPPNHPELVTSYNNIGTVYNHLGEYAKALSSCQKALEILKITVPWNHLSLAISFANIGSICRETGDHVKALSYYEDALRIFQSAPPPHHPITETLQDNIHEIRHLLFNA